MAELTAGQHQRKRTARLTGRQWPPPDDAGAGAQASPRMPGPPSGGLRGGPLGQPVRQAPVGPFPSGPSPVVGSIPTRLPPLQTASAPATLQLTGPAGPAPQAPPRAGDQADALRRKKTMTASPRMPVPY